MKPGGTFGGPDAELGLGEGGGGGEARSPDAAGGEGGWAVSALGLVGVLLAKE